MKCEMWWFSILQLSPSLTHKELTGTLILIVNTRYLRLGANQFFFIGLRGSKYYNTRPGEFVGVYGKGHFGMTSFTLVDVCWENGLWEEVG